MISARQPLLIIPDDSPIYESLYTFGCAYAHSADLIGTHGDEHKAIAFVFPAAVCQAFAIELFSKFFIVVDHPSICSKNDLKKYGVSLRKHGHSHSSMWDDVAPQYQVEIAKHYKQPNEAKTNIIQFRQRLLEIDDIPFVKWRYVHEDHDWSFLRQDQIKLITDALGFAAENRMKQTILGRIPHRD